MQALGMSLTEDEAHDLLLEVGPKIVTPFMLQHRIEVDADGSGFIEFDEFVTMMNKHK